MTHTTRPARLRAAILAGLALALGTVRMDAQTLPEYVPAGASLKYEADVKAFEEADRLSPPPKGGIVFVGSSIFRQWSALSAQMAPLPVFNRAFGGSRTWEQLYFVDRMVIPYAPAFVVYYCGSNDVNGKQDAAGIIRRFTQFSDKVHAALPDTRIFFVSVLRAPDKRARWGTVDSVNTTVAVMNAQAPWITFIDVNPTVFDAAGMVRGELYRPDSLHYVPAAYDGFTAVIKPVLEQAWAKRMGAAPR